MAETQTVKAKLKDLNNNVYVIPEIAPAKAQVSGEGGELGGVIPDGQTILADANGVISVSDSVSPDGNHATIQVRRGTEASFLSTDPILASGEWAYVKEVGGEQGVNKVKIGDGQTRFSELDYFQTDLSITGSGDIVVTTPEENQYVISSNLSIQGGEGITATKSGSTVTVASTVAVEHGDGTTVAKDGATYTVALDNTVLRDTDISGNNGRIKTELDYKQNKLVAGENIQLTDVYGSDPVANTVALYRFNNIYRTGGTSTVQGASIASTMETYPDNYDPSTGVAVFDRELVYVYLGNVVKSFAIGTNGDFTCEAFIQTVDVWNGGEYKEDWTTLQMGTDSNNYSIDIGIENGTGFVRPAFTQNGARTITTTTFPVSTFGEHHLAIVRKNGVITYYVDGTALNATFPSTLPTNLSFSSDYGNIKFNMCNKVHGFRISNVARYDGAFTPAESSYYIDGSAQKTVINALVDTSKCATKEEVTSLRNEVHTGYVTKTDHTSDMNTKQNKLTAGTNITISGNTISAKDTTYTAGDHVYISDAGVISADGPEQNIPQNVYTKDSLVHGTNTEIVTHLNKYVIDENTVGLFKFDDVENWGASTVGTSTLSVGEGTEAVQTDLYSKFGRYSLKLGATDNRIITVNGDIPTNSIAFKTQSATMDAWVRGDAGKVGLGSQNLYCKLETNRMTVYYYNAGGTASSTYVNVSLSNISNQWHHVVMQNSITHGQVEFYLDGVRKITIAHSNLSEEVYVTGMFATVSPFGGANDGVRYIDELRLSTNEEFPTETFTVHDEPYELVEDSGKMQVNATGLVTVGQYNVDMANKQPLGDYATNTALTEGLATKQPNLTAGTYITLNNNVIDVDSTRLIGTAYNKENLKPEQNSVTGVQIEFNQPGSKFVIDEDTVDVFHFDEDDITTVTSEKGVCSFSRSGSWSLVESAEHFGNTLQTANGEGSSITIGNIANLFGGSKSWTIDFRLSLGSDTETYAYTTVTIPLAGNNKLSLQFTHEYVSFGGNTYYRNMHDNNWHHYAVVYDHITKKAALFIDGINRLTYNQETISDSTTTSVVFKFGQDYYYTVQNGKLDELRITKKALWDGYSFAVPTMPYTDAIANETIEVSASIDPEVVATKEYADSKMDQFSVGANLALVTTMGQKVLNCTIDTSTLATKTELNAKQDALTAGENVTIETDQQTGLLTISADLGGSTNFVSKDDIVTTIDAQSTDDQVPSAKAIYTILTDIETQLSQI